MTNNEINDQVARIEQVQASIVETQRQQLATLQRMNDLNTFIGEYGALGSQMKELQKVWLDGVIGISTRLDTLIEVVNGEAHD